MVAPAHQRAQRTSIIDDRRGMGRTVSRGLAAMAAAWQRGRVERRGGAGLFYTRCLASSVRPRCRGIATCVPDRGRCARPAGRRKSSSELGCGSSWWGVRSSPADGIMAREKKYEVCDHAAVQVLVFQRAGAGTLLVGGALFGLGVLGFDVAVLATFGLPPGTAPAVQLALAIRMLTVALVVTTRPVFACASVAQTLPLARTAPAAWSRLATEISRTLASATGGLISQGKARGECATIRPGHCQNANQDNVRDTHRHALNQTKNKTTLEKRARTRRAGSMTNPMAQSRRSILAPI